MIFLCHVSVPKVSFSRSFELRLAFWQFWRVLTQPKSELFFPSAICGTWRHLYGSVKSTRVINFGRRPFPCVNLHFSPFVSQVTGRVGTCPMVAKPIGGWNDVTVTGVRGVSRDVQGKQDRVGPTLRDNQTWDDLGADHDQTIPQWLVHLNQFGRVSPRDPQGETHAVHSSLMQRQP